MEGLEVDNTLAASLLVAHISSSRTTRGGKLLLGA